MSYNLCESGLGYCESGLGYEQALYDLAPILARSYVEALRDLWPAGDGNGGMLLREVAEAAVDLGLGKDGAEYPVPSRVRRLAERDGWECHYCGSPLGWGHPSVSHPQIDHKVPRSKGGGNELCNLVLSCAPCNSRKGTRYYEDFVASLRVEP